jgi:hypothetical protein
MPAAFPCFGCLPLSWQHKMSPVFLPPPQLKQQPSQQTQATSASNNIRKQQQQQQQIAVAALHRTFHGSAVYFTVTCVSVTSVATAA